MEAAVLGAEADQAGSEPVMAGRSPPAQSLQEAIRLGGRDLVGLVGLRVPVDLHSIGIPGPTGQQRRLSRHAVKVSGPEPRLADAVG